METIGSKYQIIEKIGRGNFGKVYKVAKTENGEIFALKTVLKKEFNEDELKINKLKNKYLIEYFESFDELLVNDFNSKQIHICIVTEYCEDGDLGKQIMNTAKFEMQTVYNWTVELVKGVNFLHENSIIHRDLKPQNILVHKNHLKITDFGISLITKNDTSRFGEQGTADYMSLEMSNGRKYNLKTDIWSLGCVVFELLTLTRFKKYIIMLNEENNGSKLNEINDLKVPKQLNIMTQLMLVLNRNERASAKQLIDLIDSFNNRSLIDECLKKWPVDFLNLPSSPSIQTEDEHNHFIGRESYLKQMNKIIFKNKKSIVITSIAGIGKSTLANQFASSFKKEPNCFAHTINSNGADNLDAQFIELAKKIPKFIYNEKHEQSIQINKVKNILNELNEQTKILFIFANCNNYESIKKYFNLITDKVHFIITTDNNKFETLRNKTLFEYLTLQPFDQDECFKFVKKNLKRNISDETLTKFFKIVSIKEMRPFVLNKIVSHINSNETFELDNQDNSIIIDKIVQEDEFYKQIQSKNALAWSILKYSAFLDGDFVPKNIFIEILKIDKKELEEATQYLKSLSLVTVVNKKEDGYKILNLVQEEIKSFIWTKNNEIQEIKQQMTSFFEASFPNNQTIHNKSGNKLYLNTFKHIANMIFDDMDDVKKSLLLAKYSSHLNYFKKYNLALEYFDLALITSIKVLNGKENRHIISILNNIGTVYSSQAKYDLALDYFKQSLEISKTINDNTIISISLNNIASVYHSLGEYDLALQNYQQSLDLLQKLLSIDSNEKFSDLYQNIATVYRSQGNYHQALQNYEQSVTILKELYGSKDHIFFATTYGNIGSVYINKKNMKQL